VPDGEGRTVSPAWRAVIVLGSAAAAGAFAPDGNAQRGPEDLEEAAKNLVVLVEGQLRDGPVAGAGLLVGYDDGRLLIATANHVVRSAGTDATDLTVRLRSAPDAAVPAQLLKQADASLDLAVLSVAPGNVRPEALTWRRLGDSTTIERRDAIHHVGFPAGRPWRSNLTAERFGERVGDDLYFESASIGPGDSGGGLFNDRWELLGMMLADSPPEGRALRIEKILGQLRAWGYATRLRYTLFAGTLLAFSVDTGSSDGFIATSRIDGSGSGRVSGELGEMRVPESSNVPRWSPSGDRIAFVSGTDGNLEIYVARADGTAAVNVTRDPASDYSPAWSPDGAFIVYESSRGVQDDSIYARNEIWVAAADGSGSRRLTHNATNDSDPAWSPGRDRIAFAAHRDGTSDIYVMGLDGSNQVNLTRSPGEDALPAWSPDGSRIAYIEDYDLRVMNADGSKPTSLTNGAEVRSFAWSPDGTRIAVSAGLVNGSTSYRIYVIDLRNGKVLDVDHDGVGPSWSPDGRRLAFWASDVDPKGVDRPRVFVVDADGANLEPIPIEVGNYHTAVSWSPFLDDLVTFGVPAGGPSVGLARVAKPRLADLGAGAARGRR